MYAAAQLTPNTVCTRPRSSGIYRRMGYKGEKFCFWATYRSQKYLTDVHHRGRLLAAFVWAHLRCGRCREAEIWRGETLLCASELTLICFSMWRVCWHAPQSTSALLHPGLLVESAATCTAVQHHLRHLSAFSVCVYARAQGVFDTSPVSVLKSGRQCVRSCESRKWLRTVPPSPPRWRAHSVGYGGLTWTLCCWSSKPLRLFVDFHLSETSFFF